MKRVRCLLSAVVSRILVQCAKNCPERLKVHRGATLACSRSWRTIDQWKGALGSARAAIRIPQRTKTLC